MYCLLVLLSAVVFVAEADVRSFKELSSSLMDSKKGTEDRRLLVKSWSLEDLKTIIDHREFIFGDTIGDVVLEEWGARQKMKFCILSKWRRRRK